MATNRQNEGIPERELNGDHHMRKIEIRRRRTYRRIKKSSTKRSTACILTRASERTDNKQVVLLFGLEGTNLFV